MRTHILMVVTACLGLGLTPACGGDGGDGGDSGDSGDNSDDVAETPDATPQQTFPAVCDELPLECPDAASLASCENGEGAAFSSCEYLDVTIGCSGGFNSTCPSASQICRTVEYAEGVCTHSCVDDEDCPLPGGGTATCQDLGGPTICIIS